MKTLLVQHAWSYDDNDDSDLMAVCWPVHFKKASHLLLMVAFTQKLCFTKHSEIQLLLTYIALAGVHGSPPLPSGSNYPDISFARARRLTSTFRPLRFYQAAFHFRYLTILLTLKLKFQPVSSAACCMVLKEFILFSTIQQDHHY